MSNKKLPNRNLVIILLDKLVAYKEKEIQMAGFIVLIIVGVLIFFLVGIYIVRQQTSKNN